MLEHVTSYRWTLLHILVELYEEASKAGDRSVLINLGFTEIVTAVCR